jgi:3-hydroxymyristoyl/3-hydroxydecanoyl-(acyl carrier protein) dehydratase
MFSKRYPAAGFMGFTRCNDTSFRGMVVPGDTLYLLAKAVTLGARRFVTRGQGVVNGRVVFDTTISGMRM